MQLLLNSNARLGTAEEKPGCVSGPVGLAGGQSVQLTPPSSTPFLRWLRLLWLEGKNSVDWLEQNAPCRREFFGVSNRIHRSE